MRRVLAVESMVMPTVALVSQLGRALSPMLALVLTENAVELADVVPVPSRG